MKDYLIKKGHHYNSNCPITKPLFYCNKNWIQLTCTVKFTDSCIYDIDTDQSDINKLIGYSYGFHHKESDRLGWRYIKDKNQIEILLYSYNNKKRYSKSLGFFNLNQEYFLFLESYWENNTRYVSAITNGSYDTEFEFNFKPKCWGYLLTPYFGGNRTAPHDMHILMSYDLNITKSSD